MPHLKQNPPLQVVAHRNKILRLVHSGCPVQQPETPARHKITNIHQPSNTTNGKNDISIKHQGTHNTPLRSHLMDTNTTEILIPCSSISKYCPSKRWKRDDRCKVKHRTIDTEMVAKWILIWPYPNVKTNLNFLHQNSQIVNLYGSQTST